MILKWIKKDPLVRLIAVILTPLFIGIVIIAGFFIYSLIQIFDPNYEEFGPTVALYNTKECVEIEKPYFSASEDCLIYARNISTYKNNPPSLYEGIKRVVSGVSGRFEGLDFNPLDPSQWNCSVEGRIINDIQEKLSKKTYKCWPNS